MTTTPADTPVIARRPSGPRSLRPVPNTSAPTEDTNQQQDPGPGPVLDDDAGDRPSIEIGGPSDALRKLKTALGQGVIPDLYVTGGKPVKIQRVSGSTVEDLDDDAPLPVVATRVNGSLLANLLATHTYTYKTKTRESDDGSKEFYREETLPPDRILSAVLAGAEWPTTPTLAGIIGTPVLRRDWSLLQEDGYDPVSGLFLAPTVSIPHVPERPTAVQVAEARAFVVSTLLGDFEWEDTASLANFVGLLVTPFLRRPLKALVPLAIISATMPASGKSLLTALVGLLIGQKAVPWPGGDDVELRKLITTAFAAGTGAVIFDNIAEGEVISSPILANLLTNPVWSDRMLGGNGMGAFPNDRLWMCTGNNLRVGGDIASRCVYVRLKPTAPHPEERTGFAIGDLQGWIMNPQHRGELLWWLLVLVADWVAAGTPRDTSVPSMRQFTPWAQGTGGFLAHHGITGFLSNLSKVRGMDDEDAKWAIFLTRWRERLGDGLIKVNDVVENSKLTRDPYGSEVDPWDGEFITDDKGRRPSTAQKLGAMLTGQIDRYHGDPPMVLRAVIDKKNSSKLYRVEEYTP